MSDRVGLEQLGTVARDRRRGHGARLRKALLILAIPATATLATACYGAPMTASGAYGDGSYEAICDDGIDNDGDGLIDAADSECAASAKGCEE